MASKGLVRHSFQTPLEFAYSADIPEAIAITKKYHEVRFGYYELTRSEAADIEEMLTRLENRKKTA